MYSRNALPLFERLEGFLNPGNIVALVGDALGKILAARRATALSVESGRESTDNSDWDG
jgi:hypothetical protein